MKRRSIGLSFVYATSIFLFALTAILLLSLFTPKVKLSREPLADPASLSQLIAGKTLPKPGQDDHAEFHGLTVTPPQLAELERVNRVLGTTSPTDKRIEVNLAAQRVYAFDGNRMVYSFLVSTGKWAPTPTGEFRIWAKVRSQLMSGGNIHDETYYYLPNVPYVMFFANDEVAKSRGFSLHGTYWHHNFGHPMSHGCINMRISDAQLLYNWADPPVTNPQAWSTLADINHPGTRVIIYGETPEE
ncbi:hypothetical protein A2Z00_04460 [Candidatus Gottesmanbacteria bacterium RBG_13_45_10]|uniref:L,D-TPase catalytic domain-containing protein n=1 Tax=Candidatus Gottesmanbacteria bacterium RBG_13_45_10 TaxID=1798370 RepID=A0A1F5ZIR6_9BACT|nr:MAG: hypothetical protein A2Z00_04460 [Candidatus Gottesmanbacteria bacterium RBG_13_45_10]